MKTLQTTYTGRKAKTGGICFDEAGRLHVFVSYCDGCHGKVLMTVSEARDFSKKYRDEADKKRTRRIKKTIEKLTV